MEQPSWKLRRRAVFGSLLFSMGIILYVAIRWQDGGLGETLALGAYGLIGAVIAAYIGGAAYEDVKLWKPISLQDKQNNLYAEEAEELYKDDFDDTIYDESDDERNFNVH